VGPERREGVVFEEQDQRVEPSLLPKRREHEGQVEAGAQPLAQHPVGEPHALAAAFEARRRADVPEVLPRQGDKARLGEQHRTRAGAGLIPINRVALAAPAQHAPRPDQHRRQRRVVGRHERRQQLGARAEPAPVVERQQVDLHPVLGPRGRPVGVHTLHRHHQGGPLPLGPTRQPRRVEPRPAGLEVVGLAGPDPADHLPPGLRLAVRQLDTHPQIFEHPPAGVGQRQPRHHRHPVLLEREVHPGAAVGRDDDRQRGRPRGPLGPRRAPRGPCTLSFRLGHTRW